MNPYLIELHDPNLSIRDTSGLLAQSPGYANIAGKEPVFGDAARQLARLQPRHNLNQFWSQLSLDPLLIKSPHFRHSADLAHRHLQELTNSVEFGNGAVLAVPSNYTRNQLAVLLGVVKQCAFTPVGLVDQSLLQAAASQASECIVVDLQLHQAVLTRFHEADGILIKDSVVQVPASGMQALQDAWTNMITDEFLRQSRFDPKHNAETEQYLYNQLDTWISQCRKAPELMVEIHHQNAQHQARLTLEHFSKRGSTVFQRIAKELDTMRGADTALHIRSSLIGMPGLIQSLPGVIAVDDDLSVAHCLSNLDHIRRPSDSLQFVTRLPRLVTKSSATNPAQRQASHVLFAHRAIALPLGRLAFGSTAAPADTARMIPLPGTGFAGTVTLHRQARALHLELNTSEPVLCNGNAAHDGMTLHLGDSLLLGLEQIPLQLIQVE